eukprot:6490368-Amphidinium_carterae.1
MATSAAAPVVESTPVASAAAPVLESTPVASTAASIVGTPASLVDQTPASLPENAEFTDAHGKKWNMRSLQKAMSAWGK